MNTTKPRLEYSIRIRMASGDTCSVSTNDGTNFSLGSVQIREDEFADFLASLSDAVREAKALHANHLS